MGFAEAYNLTPVFCMFWTVSGFEVGRWEVGERSSCFSFRFLTLLDEVLASRAVEGSGFERLRVPGVLYWCLKNTARVL